MQINVTKWGNSLGVRIPLVLAKKIGIHEGTPVDVSIKNNQIMISKGLSLQSMLNQVTPENTHKEVNIGQSCGKESW
jgi:antitoxin MazE